jgi:hypothetical protein
MNWDATFQIEIGGNHPQPGQFHSQASLLHPDRDTNASTGGHALTTPTQSRVTKCNMLPLLAYFPSHTPIFVIRLPFLGPVSIKGEHGGAPHPAPCFHGVGHGARPLQLRIQPAPSAYPEYKGARGRRGLESTFSSR